MSIERAMFLSIVIVALVLLGMVAVVVLLRNLGSMKSAKKHSPADKPVEPTK
jgi:hypothetical protein